MAESKTKKDAAPVADPVISSESAAAVEYPEGTHAALPASEVTHSAAALKYEDRADKPDPSTIAQVQVVEGDEATSS